MKHMLLIHERMPAVFREMFPFTNPDGVADIHREVVASAWWPVSGVDAVALVDSLEHMCMCSRLQPGGHLSEFKMESTMYGSVLRNEHDKAWLFKRSGTFGGEATASWATWFWPGVKPGDVWKDRALHGSGLNYSAALFRQACTNAPCQTQTLAEGGTTISVGFVDLSVVAYSKISTSVSANLPKGDLEHHFVLIDDTAGHVATSMVLWQMARDACSPENLAQAWYSSVWTHDTEDAFRAAAAALLASRMTTRPEKITPYLEGWVQGPSVTVPAAHAAWHRVNSFDGAAFACLRRPSDRLAHAHYYITGELFLDQGSGSAGLVGSLAMFGCPCDAPPLDGTDAFQSIPMMELVQEMATHPADDMVKVASRICLAGASRLLVLARRNLRLDFACESVSPTSADRIGELRALKPEAVLWSNVLDYMVPKEFHQLAAAIATNDCVHLGYSMNWWRDTVGAYFLDYYELPPYSIEFPTPSAIHDVNGLVQAAVDAADQFYASFGIQDRFVLPPCASPINLCQGFLAQNFGAKNWAVDHFFAATNKLADKRDQKTIVAPAFVYWPFARVQGNIDMKWTYDDKLDLKPSNS